MKCDRALYREILTEVLSRQKVKVCIENLKTQNPDEMVEMVCFKTIRRIRKVLANDELSDFECIERITRLLEGIGSDGGTRHDF